MLRRKYYLFSWHSKEMLFFFFPPINLEAICVNSLPGEQMFMITSGKVLESQIHLTMHFRMPRRLHF